MRATAAILVSILLGACGGSAGKPAAAPVPANSSQVERGAGLYLEHCASCHGDGGQGSDDAPPVVGEGALALHAPAGAKRDVEFATAGDVFRWVRVAMPGDDPGSLSDEQYAAILAFALHANGVDMSTTSLDEAAADQIRLH